MSISISGGGARGGFWVGGITLLVVLSGQSAATADLSGSVQYGQSRSTINYGSGHVETQSRSGSLSIGFGKDGVRVADGRSPYGRLNFGRSPGPVDGDPAGFGGVGFSNGSFQDPLWTGLIDRSFQIMGRNSPFPHQFAGGIYNARPFRHPFGPGRFGYRYPFFGDFSYGGYAFGFGPAFYGAYVPSVYSLYGSWYPPYLPVDHVYIIEREVVKDRPAADSAGEEGEQPRERSQPTGADEGDYYLAPRSGETLDAALADIRHAWMNGDFARLKMRLPEKARVRIYLKGKYKYSVDAADFGQMTDDAMRRVDTTSFTLDHVKRLADDRAFASGRHVYYDPEHQKHDVYVSYGLAKEDGRWKITEAGSSTEPITSHSD